MQSTMFMKIKALGMFIIIVLCTSLSISAAIPSGNELKDSSNIIDNITFEKTTNSPITDWNPQWNYDLIKMNVHWSDAGLDDGSNNSPRTDGIQDKDWFRVGIPKTIFYSTLVGVYGDIHRTPSESDPDQSTPVIGKYYVENETSSPEYYWLYVEFNDVISHGSTENNNNPYFDVSGNIFLNLSFNSFGTTTDQPYTATFINSSGIDYTLSGKSPGATNYAPFQKYGEIQTSTKDGAKVYYTDQNGSYRFNWSIRINYELNNQGEFTTYENLVVKDKLIMPADNPTHEYIMVNDMPAFALYEYTGNNAQADLSNGTMFDSNKSIIYTNTNNFTRPSIISQTTIKGQPLSDFITMSADKKSVSFDMKKIFGTINKPYRLEVYTKTTPKFSMPNYNLNSDTGIEFSQLEFLKSNIRNEIYVDGSYKFGTNVSIPKITHGANAVGQNHGRLKLNKISGTLENPILITSDNPTFDLYKKLSNNQYSFLYQISLVNGTYTTSLLDYGDYRLIETKAPAGYIIDSTPHEFNLSSTTIDSSKIFNYNYLNLVKPPEKNPEETTDKIDTPKKPLDSKDYNKSKLPDTGFVVIEIVPILMSMAILLIVRYYNRLEKE